MLKPLSLLLISGLLNGTNCVSVRNEPETTDSPPGDEIVEIKGDLGQRMQKLADDKAKLDKELEELKA